MRRHSLLLAVCLVLLPAIPCTAQSLADVRVPMGDGEWLAADVYLPEAAGPTPAILVQTPYDKDHFRNLSRPFVEAGYAMVTVDWRGRFGSWVAGRVERDLGLDSFDAVEWVAAQSWCDGRVGTWGSSALGAVQLRGAELRPPHLVCAVPRVIGQNAFYEEYYSPGGVLRRARVLQLALLGFGDSALVFAYPVNGPFWDLVSTLHDPAAIEVPMLLIGGWYDHRIRGVLRTYLDLRDHASPFAREHLRLIIGPWTHGGIDSDEQGELEWPDADDLALAKTLMFFDHWLRDADNGWEDEPEARIFRMGDDLWLERLELVPPSTSSPSLFLGDDGSLAEASPSTGSVLSFAYDPTDPSPTVGGLIPELIGEAGPKDQAEVLARADALIWQGPALERSLSICGEAAAVLYVTSDRVDTDFSARLCDIFPDGRWMLLADGITRLRFAGGNREEHFRTPDDVTRLEVAIDPTCHTFLPDHKVGLIVSSSNFPRFDANPNNGQHFSDQGTPQVANNTVFVGGGTPSAVRLPVTPPEPRTPGGRVAR